MPNLDEIDLVALKSQNCETLTTDKLLSETLASSLGELQKLTSLAANTVFSDRKP